ncbi:MAG: ABC transporter permease [Clostridiales bacterium]|jgi:hypothetical protein|nr:ABC transporter permease [Clostridiales bacterium]
MKTSLIYGLAYRQIKGYKTRSAVVLAGIILCVGMLTAVILFYGSANAFLMQYTAIKPDPSAHTTLNFTVTAFEAILFAGALAVISNMFAVSANERLRAFGLLKSAGATREQLRGMVIAEALIMSSAGIPLGLLTGAAFDGLAIWAVNSVFQSELNAYTGGAGGSLAFVLPVANVLISVGLSFFAVITVAWIPARKAARISPIGAIRLERGIQARKVMRAGILSRCFGFMGVLADKSQKRDNRHRATVIALAACVAVFVAGSSFNRSMDDMVKAMVADSIYSSGYPYSHILLTGTRNAAFHEAAEGIAGSAGAPAFTVYTTVTGSEESGSGMTQYYLLPEDVSEAEAVGSDSLPPGVLPLFPGADNWILPRADFNRIAVQGGPIMAIISVEAPVIPEETAAALTGLEAKGIGYRIIGMTDIAITLANSAKDSSGRLISLFLNGIMAVIALTVGISAAVAVSSSLALRRRDMALLFSAGMTRRGMSEMLAYESLLYALKALITGAPLGILASWFLYRDMSQNGAFGYMFPWASIALSAAAIFALIFCVTGLAARRMKGMNIASEIADYR